jgi:hypothetical protein
MAVRELAHPRTKCDAFDAQIALDVGGERVVSARVTT